MFFRFARTIDTIESLKDVIEKTEQYQKDVAEHIKKASEIETIPEVLLKRIENWSSKRIEYFVSVRHIPQVEIKEGQRHLYIRSTENQKFEGKQRSLALKIAKELSEKYQCEIRREGFKK